MKLTILFLFICNTAFAADYFKKEGRLAVSVPQEIQYTLKQIRSNKQEHQAQVDKWTALEKEAIKAGVTE